MAEVFELVNQESLKRLQNEQEKHDKNKKMLANQHTIIENIFNSVINQEDSEEKYQEVSTQLEEVEIALKEHKIVLQNLLQKEKKPQANPEIGNLIKSLIISIQNSSFDMILKVLNSKSAEIELADILEVEKDISSTVDSLKGKNMFPETKQEEEQRKLREGMHIKKVVDFINNLGE